ncbi:MAG: GAF domain-containing protein [Anaerolineae bacterium]|nr:GAF domain-containing protein [Anaerolineae bacterium]
MENNESVDGTFADVSSDDTDRRELWMALNSDLRDSLPQMALIFGVLFIVLSVGHFFSLSGSLRATMIPLALSTSAINFAAAYTLRRRTLPARWSHFVAVMLSLTILFNTCLHLYLSADPLQTTNVLLFVIGVGFILFSSIWWAVLVGVSVGGWLLIVLVSGPDPAWSHFGFAILSATSVSFMVHLIRRRTYLRLEKLRRQDAKRQVRLEAALRSTERVQSALAITVGVTQRITQVLELETLLAQVVDLIKARYGYYYVGIFLLDEARTYVELRAGTGEAGAQFLKQKFQLKVGEEGLIGWVAKNRQALNITDVAQEPRYMKVDMIPDTRSELVLPLEVADKILGILDIQSEKLWAFHEDDVRVLESLAGQVSIAIQNALQYQAERKRRLFSEKLQDVGRALSRTMLLADVLNVILEQLDAIVPFDRAAVMLESGSEMVIPASRGFPDSAQAQTLRVQIKEGDIYLNIRETRQPILIPDVSERVDWQHVEGLPLARSWLGVPLVHEDVIIGMLSLTRERPDPFTPEEVMMAAAFAAQAAVALENARLYDNLNQVNQTLEETVRQLQERTETLRTTYEQLERLDRTKSDFIGVASHELRTPLTVINGYTQMLLGDAQLKSNTYHHQLLEGIQAGIVRLQSIMGSMLDMAKIDSQILELYPEPLSLNALIQTLQRRLVEEATDRQLTIQIEGLESLPMIKADVEAIRKVFHNLLGNAIKYTPDGGIITISGQSLPPETPDFPQGGVEIAIHDTGIGIDPGVKQLIFTKFYQTGEVALHSTGTTKFKGGGPGLGLAIARGIVEAHGGKIWAESPGYDETACPGSTFFVRFPLNAEDVLTPKA